MIAEELDITTFAQLDDAPGGVRHCARRESGFEFVAASEINANPKDNANWPKGAWPLPPTFALGDEDRAKYTAVGEADNLVLKFRKPAS